MAFIDFKKAFDSVSHDILEMKLNQDFGITGTLLDWLNSYLHGRQQFTVLNGVKSECSRVSFGKPQGSVLGPTLFTLFTNDLPASVSSGSLYMYADDTKAYCIRETIDIAIAQLNKTLKEVYTCCLTNRLTPHPGKSEVMLQCSSDISELRIRVLYERILHIRVCQYAHIYEYIRAHIRVYTRIYARICLFVMHSHKFLYVKHC